MPLADPPADLEGDGEGDQAVAGGDNEADGDRGEAASAPTPLTPRFQSALRTHCDETSDSAEEIEKWLRSRQVHSLFALDILVDELTTAHRENGPTLPSKHFFDAAQESAEQAYLATQRVANVAKKYNARSSEEPTAEHELYAGRLRRPTATQRTWQVGRASPRGAAPGPGESRRVQARGRSESVLASRG